jgi:hypothetical protein
VESTTSADFAPASSEAEQYLLDCVESQRIADFTSRPPAQRRIGAGFLEALIAGSRDAKEPPGGALRVRGAEIVGLLCASGDRGYATLLFWSCSFDSPVDLSGRDFAALRFVDCTMPALIGASLTTKADLDLTGSRFSGVSDYVCELTDVGTCAIHLSNARIGGRLVMSSTSDARFTAHGIVRLDGARIDGSVSFAGALLDGDGDAALNARSMTVGGDVSCVWAGGRRFEAMGEVALGAARITGDLSLNGAKLTNPAGRALHCEDLKVESVFLGSYADTPVEVRGRLNFLSATVDGSFIMSSARIAPGPDTDLIGRGGPVALNLQQLRVSNALAVRNIGALEDDGPPPSRSSPPIPVRGWYLLSGAQLNHVMDDLDTGWPAPGYLDLEGATYEGLRTFGVSDVASQRIAWLRRQFPNGRPTAETFRPQPYEELTRVLRRHGQTREADAVAVEKIRMRLAARVDPAWARIFPKILMLVSHHGYSSSRAVLSFLIFVLLGAVMYGIGLWGFGQHFTPFEASPEPVEYALPFDLARVRFEAGCPGLDVMQFALDTALPVINLGQDTYCRFTPRGPWRWFWLLLHSIYTLAGTALSAVVVLTLTGILRRD